MTSTRDKDLVRDDLALVGGQEVGPLAVMRSIFADSPPDSIIAIGSRRPSKTNPEPHPYYLLPMPVANITAWLPVIAAYEFERRQTTYFSPHLLGQAALEKGSPEKYLQRLTEGKFKPWRFFVRKPFVVSLASLVLDLDVGRIPPADEPDPYQAKYLEPWYALAGIQTRVEAGILPPPSLAALSGRGCYIFWNLYYVSPQSANIAETITQYHRVVTAIFEKTKDLASDEGASRRVPGWFKLPGTRDTSTDRRVRYAVFAEGAVSPDSVPRYHLPDLMERVGVQHFPASPYDAPPPRKREVIEGEFTTIDDDRKPRRRRRRRKQRNVKRGKGGEPHRAVYSEIEMLSQHRGGIREGCRALAIFYMKQSVRRYQNALQPDTHKGHRNADMAATAAVRELNKTFQPPLSGAEINAALKKKSKALTPLTVVHNATIAHALGVTREEADTIPLLYLIPAEVKRDRKDYTDMVKTKDRVARQTRLEAIKAGLLAGHTQAAIAREHGVSRQRVHTIKRDMEAADEWSPVDLPRTPAVPPPETPPDGPGSPADDRQGVQLGLGLDAPDSGVNGDQG